jgi:hypothetical protein
MKKPAKIHRFILFLPIFLYFDLYLTVLLLMVSAYGKQMFKLSFCQD